MKNKKTTSPATNRQNSSKESKVKTVAEWGEIGRTATDEELRKDYYAHDTAEDAMIKALRRRRQIREGIH